MSDLSAYLQQQPILDLYVQYGRLLQTLYPYHDQHFATYQAQYTQIVGHQRHAFQPSWNQFMDGISNPTTTPIIPSASSLLPSSLVSHSFVPLSRMTASTEPTRPYRSRMVVPGFCNQERTGEQCMNIRVPKTPMDEYTRPNMNKEDRVFKSQQTIRIYEFSQLEWIELARKCIHNIKVMQMNYQPLTQYCQYVLKMKSMEDQKKNVVSKGATPTSSLDPKLLSPCIFSAKLTSAQKAELLDAFYWSEMKQQKQYTPILHYYKLLGWFVRIKDGYRMTKHHIERQSVLKRNDLIQNGTATLQLRYAPPIDRIKSDRGRKRKQNVTL